MCDGCGCALSDDPVIIEVSYLGLFSITRTYCCSECAGMAEES